MTKYIAISLEIIVQKVTGHSVDFFNLDDISKVRVLRYIDSYKIGLKIFEAKWYDVITKKFYAKEYILDSANRNNFCFKVSDFDSFGQFYVYVAGKIYDRCCLFGFDIPTEYVEKYSIDLTKINFVSFQQETIDDYSVKAQNEKNKIESNIKVQRIKRLKRFIDNNDLFSSFECFNKVIKKFVKEFGTFFKLDIFLSLIIGKYKDKIKDFVLEYACSDSSIGYQLLNEILLNYGENAAEYLINNYHGKSNVSHNYDCKGDLKDYLSVLKEYERCNKRVYFNRDLWLYCIEYYYGNEFIRISPIKYIFEFDELLTILDNDLSDVDLTFAPLTSENINNARICKSTTLPISNEVYKVVAEKGYDYCKLMFSTVKRFYVNIKAFNHNGNLLTYYRKEFDYFFDFLHFLKGDLSNADFLLLDDAANILSLTDLDLNNIKIRSKFEDKATLDLSNCSKDFFTKTFEKTHKMEVSTKSNLINMAHFDDDEYKVKLSYITDIHLIHKLIDYNCKNENDVDYAIKIIAKNLVETSTKINLIGGDTSSDFFYFEKFVKTLNNYSSNENYFFVLGNHELWDTTSNSFEKVVERYSKKLKEIDGNHLHLVQNNIFYLVENFRQEISEKELNTIEDEELRKKLRKTKMVIFGGVGFSGRNNDFNANNGIYLKLIDRNHEIMESQKFLKLYEKVIRVLHDKNLVILTHMPLKDWGGDDLEPQDEVIYINGHTHNNYYFDNGTKRVYSDNQIGYHNKEIAFKSIGIDNDYDWFADYDDGIFKIDKADYIRFCRGISSFIRFRREYKNIYMVKRNKYYVFLAENSKKELLILNGGKTKNLGRRSLDYFYENLPIFAQCINTIMTKYTSAQKEIAKLIKYIGGQGRIHGCIIDIDFYNHVFLNPLDGKITAYYATSMTDKKVYRNIASLLKFKCNKLFVNLEKMNKNEVKFSNVFHLLKLDDISISDEYFQVNETDIYSISRIIKSLQYITKNNVVRLWNDEFLKGLTTNKNVLLMLLGEESSNDD